MTQISSITRGPRQSNMELLRIIAMLLVVVVHADFYSLGEPTKEDFYNSPVNFLTRTFFEAVSIICVNVFILISGWFGIKASCKGLMNFFFQCGYFLFGIYILMIVLGDTNFSLKGIAACLCLVNPNWFIIAYLGLYLLSPLINKWLEVASKKHIEKFLLCFFLFQAYVGWIGETVWINWGCSTFSFIGLYVLGKYLHISNTQGFKWGGYFGYLFWG